MKILIKNGRLVDPASGLDQVGDLAITASRITALGNVSADFEPDRVIDATGLIVAPGLVDLAVRLREPGHEHEGMLESELAAAAAGGVTSVVCLPDTDPTLDEPGLVEMLKLRARKLSRCRLFPLGALTRGLKGENLTEMAELHEAGCVGYSQAESPIRDTQVLQRAMLYASTFGYTVWLRPHDPWLGKGVAASGAVATRLGLSGVPVSAETIAIHTIVELVRQAKAQGLPITADVSINSLMLTDVDIGYFNSSMRVTPPLRQGRDRDALRAGLLDGTLDALVSDHNPVSEDEKTLPFGEATPGATGVELLLSLTMKWSGADQQDQPAPDKLRQALSVVTQGPVKVLGDALGSLTHSAGRLVAGGVADIVMFDPAARWQVQPSALVSQGKHTPFAFESTGFELAGRVRLTLVAGQVAHDAQDRADA